jgi:hypothetical protein
MRTLILGAAGAVMLFTTVAAEAGGRRWRHHHRDDVDAGDVIAGAIVVGGIAALLSSSNGEKRRRQDAAVDMCAGEAESRTGDRVAAITDVSRRRGYYTVVGELEGDGGYGDRFRCTVRNGTIYSFDSRGGAI